MFRTFPSKSLRPIARTLCAGAVTVMALSGCEKVKSKLYANETAPPVDQSWRRDSSLVAKKPALLFKTVQKGNERLVMPIAVLSGGSLKTLRMSKRGWNYLDIAALNNEQQLIPVASGVAGGPVKIQQRMWENAASPVDSLPGCPNMIPVVRAALPAGVDLAVMNYSLPTGMKSLSAGEVEQAVSAIPQLVTPTIGVRAAQLAQFYSRRVHQVLRTDENPAVLVEYHDDRPPSDTSVLAARRPRHMIIVMEKGVYGYRPGWVYHTAGRRGDPLVLRFLESMDIDGDGRAELFLEADTHLGKVLYVFRRKLDTWTELWTRPPVRCDV